MVNGEKIWGGDREGATSVRRTFKPGRKCLLRSLECHRKSVEESALLLPRNLYNEKERQKGRRSAIGLTARAVLFKKVW